MFHTVLKMMMLKRMLVLKIRYLARRKLFRNMRESLMVMKRKMVAR
jgi:hypothetical protein